MNNPVVLPELEIEVARLNQQVFILQGQLEAALIGVPELQSEIALLTAALPRIREVERERACRIICDWWANEVDVEEDPESTKHMQDRLLHLIRSTP